MKIVPIKTEKMYNGFVFIMNGEKVVFATELTENTRFDYFDNGSITFFGILYKANSFILVTDKKNEDECKKIKIIYKKILKYIKEGYCMFEIWTNEELNKL